MNMTAMPIRQEQQSTTDVMEPVDVPRRNRELLRLSVLLLAIVVIMVVAVICAFQRHLPPVDLP